MSFVLSQWGGDRKTLTLLFQGCGIGVETGVGVGRSRPFLLESESELESVNSGRLRPGVADKHPPTEYDFGRTIMHPPENIKGRKKDNSIV